MSLAFHWKTNVLVVETELKHRIFYVAVRRMEHESASVTHEIEIRPEDDTESWCWRALMGRIQCDDRGMA